MFKCVIIFCVLAPKRQAISDVGVGLAAEVSPDRGGTKLHQYQRDEDSS